MHPNPIYRQEGRAHALAFARTRGFGTLTICGGAGVLAAHVPFVLHEDDGEGGAALEAHLVRSNPIARALRDGPVEALLAVVGPDAYISPDWYGIEDQVPTWNYVAVHLRGKLRLRDPEELRAHLDRLSAHFETMLAPKPAWTADKMSPPALEKLMRAILPVAMTVESVDSTFKLNQNKTPAARLGAAEALARGGTPGAEIAALVALMRGVGEEG